MTKKTATPRPYHHGDLRNTMIDLATAQVRSGGGPQAVVIREVAREAGVSPAAAYRHFSSQQELVLEVKHRALELLSAKMIERRRRVGRDPRKVLRALGRAYVEFAVTEQGLFRLAFTRTDPKLEHSWDGSVQDNSFQMLNDVLDDLVTAGDVDPSGRAGLEIVMWAGVHGVAMLCIDEALPDKSERARTRAVNKTVDLLLAGAVNH